MTTTHLARCLGVWVAATGAATATCLWATDTLAWSSTESFDTLVTALAGALLIACALWAWGVTSMVIVEALRSRDDHRRPRSPETLTGVPSWARRLVLAACGVALVSAAQVVPAGAATDDATLTGEQAPTGTTADLGGLPLPDRATGPLTARRTSAADRTHASVGHAAAAVTAVVQGLPRAGDRTVTSVVVAPGDSLWSIAERLLAPGSGVDQVADLVSRLYATNRTEIGADPDLIQPGHQLRTPLGERPAR